METIVYGDFGAVIKNADTCWRCGKKTPDVKITIHHGIPQTLTPKKNVEIPVCEECHEDINKQDIMSVLQFVYKLGKNTEDLISINQQLLSQTRKASQIIENIGVIKIKTRGQEK